MADSLQKPFDPCCQLCRYLLLVNARVAHKKVPSLFLPSMLAWLGAARKGDSKAGCASVYSSPRLQFSGRPMPAEAEQAAAYGSQHDEDEEEKEIDRLIALGIATEKEVAEH